MQAALSQTEANRANAQHSTGPKKKKKKKRSALNSYRHGLTGQIMVLTTEELVAYNRHCDVFLKKHQPADEYEERLVQILADTSWRLMRVPAIEANILTLGLRTYEGGDEGSLRVNLATATEFSKQAKALANITLYEQRMTRQFERTLAQLRELQSERLKQPEQQEKQQVASPNCFVYSTTGISTNESSDLRPSAFIGGPNDHPQARTAPQSEAPPNPISVDTR